MIADGRHANAATARRQVVFSFNDVVTPGGDQRRLAVAFHSLDYLDKNGVSLGQILFGTPNSNAVQGDGWYGNEVWPGVGSFQWAGGTSKRAVLSLMIPENTEALLFHVNSIGDNIEMNVTVDEVQVASLRPGAYWHLEYIPLKDDMPRFTDLEEPKWVQGQSFPNFPQTDRIYVLEVPNAMKDWWGAPSKVGWRISDSLDTMNALTLVGMQGVINRYGPKVYLNWEDTEYMNDAAGLSPSEFWLPILEKQVAVIKVPLRGQDAINFLYQRYKGYFKGVVIYEPQVPDTINLATMLAGLDNQMILAPQQIGIPGMPINQEIRDLRTLVTENGWDASEDSKYRIYNWAYENLWPSLEHRILGMACPGPPSSERILPSENYLPLGLAARDYIVALRLSAIWLSPLKEPQKELYSQYLSDCPNPIPVFGLYGTEEEGTVALNSRYGDWNAVIVNPNTPLAAGSLTVFSGVIPELVEYRQEMNIDRIFATLGDKPIFMLWNSDGDSLQFQMDRGFHDDPPWVWEDLQGQIFGWQTNPLLFDIAPAIWNYYMESRDEVSMVSCLSGAGYTYPQLMSGAQLEAYVDHVARYLDRTGLRVIQIDDRFGPFDDIAPVYNQGLEGTPYLGAIEGLAGFPWGLSFYYSGGPNPVVRPSYVSRTTNVKGIVDNLFSRKSSEVFVDLAGAYPWYWEEAPQSSYLWHNGEEVDDSDAHAGEALVFTALNQRARGLAVWGPFASLAPGEYTVVYRLKVSSNLDNKPLAVLDVGTYDDDWVSFARRSVSPREFSQAGKYQNFTLHFTLDQFVNRVEFRLEYYGGEDGNWAKGDLTADYIIARRVGGLNMPVFGAGFVAMMGSNRLTNLESLTDQITEAGGTVVHPDEYMAALNPEFMLEWAAPILGEDNTQLSLARQKLSRGDYLGSLLTTRLALANLPERNYRFSFEEGGEPYTFRLRANTYIDPINYDPGSYSVNFRTHGPPAGEVTASVILPIELQAEKVKINVDAELVSFTSESNSTHTTISLTFPQGAHSVQVVLPFNEPPKASFYNIPERPSVLDTVSFKDTSSDTDGVITSWSWSFGDGSVSSVRNPVHRYAAKGIYTVKLVVRDDGGAQGEKLKTVQVINLPPETDFSVDPETLLAMEDVRFTNLSNDPDGRIARYYWDFGDGAGSTLVNPVHVYQAPGEKNVRLTAWDDDGASDTDTLTLYINELYTLTVSVKDPLGLPVSGAQVEVIQDGDICGGEVTDASGEAEVRDLHPGTYEVRAKNMGVTTTSLVSVDADESILVTVTLSLSVICIAVVLLAVIALILRRR
jgi:PKD repeat protein